MRRARDTSETAAVLVKEINRSLGPERRLLQAMELSDFVRELARAGIRSRHPEYSEAEVRRSLTTSLYGDLSRRT